MTVAYEARSQEDEHSCFSDNTVADIVGNAIGIQMVLEGNFGTVMGPGILDLIAVENPALAEQLAGEVELSIAQARQIPSPFDQHLAEGVPDSAPGRMQTLRVIESLENQTDTIVSAATAVGITISVS